MSDHTPTRRAVLRLGAVGVLVVERATGGPADGRLQPSTDGRIVDGTWVPVGGDGS